MNFFLKILNAAKAHATLRVNGSSGLLYVFKWDDKLRAYAYQPKNQTEVDDLFKTMGRTTSYVFCPVSESAQSAGNPPPPPLVGVKPEPLPAALIEMALFRGIIVTEDDAKETVERLVAAYDKGATEALNSLPAVKRKPRKPQEAEAAAPE